MVIPTVSIVRKEQQDKEKVDDNMEAIHDTFYDAGLFQFTVSQEKISFLLLKL
jgi:hypothetical protein